MRTFHDAKAMAKTLRETLNDRDEPLKHGEALDIVARLFGLDDWNVLSAKIEADKNVPVKPVETIVLQPPIPILRIFSVEKAMEFYRDFLGFKVDWEHRFGDNFPLYAQVSRGVAVLHLSEHSGDASPGARVFIRMTGVVDLHAELHAHKYRYMKPGIHEQPWGRELQVTDPFSNRLTFCEGT
jgi:uncharacterized glyoxalase superfamily protein PhnB